MMNANYLLLRRFVRYGVLHREAVKNNQSMIRRLISSGFVQKVFKSGRVFYELTDKALPLIERVRLAMLEEARLFYLIEASPSFFHALLEDVRFLDETRREAKDFLFLGDWQLTRPAVAAQLELAKLRFYRECVSKRTRKAA